MIFDGQGNVLTFPEHVISQVTMDKFDVMQNNGTFLVLGLALFIGYYLAKTSSLERSFSFGILGYSLLSLFLIVNIALMVSGSLFTIVFPFVFAATLGYQFMLLFKMVKSGKR